MTGSRIAGAWVVLLLCASPLAAQRRPLETKRRLPPPPATGPPAAIAGPFEHRFEQRVADFCTLLETEPGYVQLDMPWTVDLNQPFKADVWLEACQKQVQGRVEIRMEQTSDADYEPRVFTLQPGAHQTVMITIKRSPGGLAEVIATPPRPWLPAHVSLSVGFAATLRPSMDDAIEAGSVQAVSLDFVDSHGSQVSLGAPVTVQVAAEKGLLRAGMDSPWLNRIALALKKGATSTPTFEMRGNAVAPDRGVLEVVATMNNGFILRDQKFSFTIVPQWWLQLVVGILGGLLHASSQTLANYSRASRRPRFVRLAAVKLLTGAVAGSIAYLLASWNVLGIRVDTTSLRAFALLGFLFSYLGVDAVVRRLLPAGNGRALDRAREPAAKPPEDEA